MNQGNCRLIAAAAGFGLGLSGFVSEGNAQSAGNSAFQTFFGGTVCGADGNGTAYRARCGDTQDPTKPVTDPTSYADISPSSESSLNPSQVAAAASNSLRTAEALAMQTEKRLEGLRDEDDGKPGAGGGKIAGFGPWSLFGSVDGEWFDQSRRAFANERAFDGHRYRGSVGADYRLGADTHLGMMVSYEKYSMTFDAESGGANAVGSAFAAQANAGGRKARTWTISAFASTALSERAWFDIAAGYGWSSNDFRRNATFQANLNPNSTAVQAFGSADGKQTFASVGVGYDLAAGAISVGPYARLRYVQTRVDGYTEQETTSSALNFVVPRQKAKSMASILGVRTSYAIGTSWGVIVPQVRIEYEHEFQDDARTTAVRFAAQPTGNALTLAITSDRPDRNYFNLGASLLFVLPNGVMPYIDYEGLVGYSHFKRNRITAGLRIEF